jgi:hypothetical protein
VSFESTHSRLTQDGTTALKLVLKALTIDTVHFMIPNGKTIKYSTLSMGDLS